MVSLMMGGRTELMTSPRVRGRKLADGLAVLVARRFSPGSALSNHQLLRKRNFAVEFVSLLMLYVLVL
jgi:hypothetical protein